MTTLKAECDACGEIIKGRIYEDYDHIQRCQKCYLESELYYAESQYNGKLNWLKKTHIEDLKNMRQKISRLKKELESYKKANSADTKDRAAD